MFFRLMFFTVFVFFIFSCQQKKEDVRYSDILNVFKDSLTNKYKYKIDIDLDSTLSNFRNNDINTLTFQQIDSNKICFYSDFQILDISRIDSSNYNIEVVDPRWNQFKISLTTNKKNLILKLLKWSDSNKGASALFRLNNNSFHSVIKNGLEDETSKLIVGEGVLLDLFEHPPIR